jgi:hypothetical protein
MDESIVVRKFSSAVWMAQKGIGSTSSVASILEKARHQSVLSVTLNSINTFDFVCSEQKNIAFTLSLVFGS